MCSTVSLISERKPSNDNVVVQENRSSLLAKIYGDFRMISAWNQAGGASCEDSRTLVNTAARR